MSFPDDTDFMRMALAVARRGLGRTAPNPSVGCVIVKDGIVLARGRTADLGRPHAEAAALAQAGHQAKGATAYVTLEPCAFPGREGPCVEALIDAEVKRVVVACIDPNPQVLGQGITKLEEAGIEVTVGVLEEEARALNAGFMLKITEGRPFVTLKLATSVDGKIAAAEGARTQISGPLAQKHMHLIRSQHDAILIGANTQRIDEPLLTTRIDGYEHQSLRVVLDGGVCLPDETVDVDPRDLKAVLTVLAERGITRLLVEGGAKMHTSFLEAGYCDQFIRCKSPIEIGPQGVDALAGHDIEKLKQEFGFKKQKTRALGEDLLEIYTRSD